MDETRIDEAYLSFSEFVVAASEIDGAIADPGKGVAMEVEQATLGMPVEMDVVVDDDGSVAIGTIPPLYYLETSMMPVFHQVTLTLEELSTGGHGK